MHIVLLGDSIFDNKPYVGRDPEVIVQLKNALPAGDYATLLAVDGAVIESLPAQLKKLPIFNFWRNNMQRFVLILLVVFFMAACGTVPQSPAATATAVLTETATISTTDVLGGVLTVIYPQNWSATESEGTIVLGSQPNISPESTVPTGETAVGILGIAPVAAATIVTDGAITPAKVLDAYKATLDTNIQLGEVTEMALNGTSAAKLSASSNEGDSLIVAIEQDGAFIVVIGVAAKGEMPQREALIFAIAENASYDIAAE